MGIDKPWEHDPVSGINDKITIRNGIIGRTVNGDDVAPLDHYPPILNDPARPVHREHKTVLDRDSRHRQHQSLTAAP